MGADNTELIKDKLMKLSDSSQASFGLGFVDPGQENSPEYYWYLQDNKYLSTEIGLNKSLDVKTFNSRAKINNIVSVKKNLYPEGSFL